MTSVRHDWRIVIGKVLIPLGYMIVCAASITAWFLPRIYQAWALVRVIYAPEALKNVDPAVVDQLTRTQGVLVLSDAVLEEVVRKLGLCEKWGLEKNEDRSPLDPRITLHLLKRITGVVYPGDTVGLIRIHAFSEDPTECRDIANAVAEGYVGRVQAEPKQDPFVTDAVVVEPASRPLRPVRPDFVRIVLIGVGICVAATVAGIALIIWGARASRPAAAGMPNTTN